LQLGSQSCSHVAAIGFDLAELIGVFLDGAELELNPVRGGLAEVLRDV
jgi:hypothetical protein